MNPFRKEEDLMVELVPKFQTALFSELIKIYGRKNLAKKLKKSKAMVYHYKNNFVRAIPKIVVQKAANLSTFSKEDLFNNIKRTFSIKESINKIFERGIISRRKQLEEELSIKFGSLSMLKQNNRFLSLGVRDWLSKNKWLEKISKQRGILKNVKIERNSKTTLVVSYLAYSRRMKAFGKYIITLPTRLEINEDLCYFLGILYGDGLNGARVGIVNKNKALIKWTGEFLNENFNGNKLKAILNLYQNNQESNLEELIGWLNTISNEVEVYKNLNARGSYVFNIFITNKILRRILNDFLDNLEDFFKKLTFQQRGAFLAGFFDAEGNVNKLDRNLRFSQLIVEKVRAIKEILLREGYHTRYDGSSIIIGFKKEYREDINLFKKQILPFLKHPEKRKQAEELIQGYLVREEYKPILLIITQNPEITQKEISEKIRRVKSNAKLVALVNAGFVSRTRKKVDESFKYTITDKGLGYLEKK